MSGPNQLNRLRDSKQPLSTRQQDTAAQVVNPVVQAVNRTPIGGAPPPAWIRPSLLADFVDGGAVQQTAYHRNALGYTYLKVSVSTVAGQAGSTPIFILDKGYRPNELTALWGVIGLGGANTHSPVVITAIGQVASITAIPAGSNFTTYVSFLAVF